MNWTINLMGCMALTALTGGIFLAAWLCLKWAAEKRGYIEFLYRALWPATLFFLVPAAFLCCLFRARTGEYAGTGAWPGCFSPSIKMMGERAAGVWLCGAALLLLLYGVDFLRYRYQIRNKIRCGGMKYAVFCRTLEELGLSEGKVGLYESYHVRTPMVTGLWRPKVLLPAGEYGEMELQVIFLHELSHYRQKDLWLKSILRMAVIWQWFNPAVWVLRMLVWRWSEYACDSCVCRKTGKAGEYFGVILSLTEPARGWTDGGRSLLLAHKHELTRRVEKMKKCFKKELPKMRWVYGLCTALLLCGTVSVYASSEGLLAGYDRWYEETDVAIEEEEQPFEEMTEYEETGDNGLVEEMDESAALQPGARSGNKEWTVKAGTRKTSAGFSAKSGQTIEIVAILLPADLSINVGIIEPDGTRRYVTGKRAVSHDFKLDQTGTYKTFIENKNSKSIKAIVSYAVK